MTSAALARRVWHIAALAGLMSVLVVILLMPHRINHDVAMYLYMGGALLDGHLPYISVIDLNPPLIIYLSVLPAAAARLLGAYPPIVLLVLVWGFAVGSFYACRRVLGTSPLTDLVAVALVGASMWVYKMNAFGQREHLFILGFMPYFLLRCRRESSGEIPSRAEALALGLVAGVVSSLKPHFVIAALAPEIYWSMNRRPPRWRIPIEVTGFLSCVVLYAAHFLLLPDAVRDAWFGRWLPMIAAGYGTYHDPSVIPSAWKSWLLGPVAAMLMLMMRRSNAWRPFGPPLLIVIGGLMAAALAQQKGWDYHWIPVQAACATAAALAGSVVMTRWGLVGRLSARAVKTVAAVGVVVLACEGVAVAVLAMRPPAAYVRVRLAAHDSLAAAVLAHTEPGDAIWMFETSVRPAFPLLVQLGRRQASRYMFAFPLPMIYRDQRGVADRPFVYQLDNGMRASEEARFRTDLLEDLAAARPRMIVVYSGCQGCPPGFSLQGYLEATGVMDTVMNAYREGDPVVGARIYLRRE